MRLMLNWLDAAVHLLCIVALGWYMMQPRYATHGSVTQHTETAATTSQATPKASVRDSNVSSMPGKTASPSLEIVVTDKNATFFDEEEIEAWMRLAREAAQEEATVYTPRRLVGVSLTRRFKELGVRMGVPVFIRIFKAESLLEVWVEKEGVYEHLKDYEICAWSGRLGPKLKEGDRQSPEGFYRVYRRSLNPHSRFHLSFNLGFPNAYDRAHGRTGSYLMVHGDCCSVGCYAMTDRYIEEIYALVEAALKAGQSFVPVHIFPFRMDDERLAGYADHRWFDFWMELKAGYDYFEAERRVPRIRVRRGRYVVEEPS